MSISLCRPRVGLRNVSHVIHRARTLGFLGLRSPIISRRYFRVLPLNPNFPNGMINFARSRFYFFNSVFLFRRFFRLCQIMFGVL